MRALSLTSGVVHPSNWFPCVDPLRTLQWFWCELRARIGTHLGRLAAFFLATLLGVPASAQAEDASLTVAPRSAPDEAEPAAGALSETRVTGEAGASLARALEPEPGLRVRSTGGPGSDAFLSIRGGRPGQVRFLLDGVPLHGASEPRFNLNSLPPALLDSARVYRSIVPLHVGAPAAGGVVDLRTASTEGRRVSARAGAGSFGYRQAAAGISLSGDDSNTLALVSYSGARGDYSFYDDFGTPFTRSDDAPDRPRTNNYHDEAFVLVRHRLRPGRWRMTMVVLGGGRDAGIPAASGVQTQSTSLQRARSLVSLHALRTRLWQDRLDLRLLASGSWSYLRVQDPDAELSAVQLDSRQSVWMTQLAAKPLIWLDPLRLRLLAESQTESFSRDDAPGASSAFRWTGSTGVEVEARLWDGRIVPLAGVRFDVLSNTAADSLTINGTAAEDETLVSPYAGLAWVEEPGDFRTRLFATGSVAERPPGFLELYGDQGQQRGNAELVSERRVGFDLGVDLNWTDDESAASFGWSFFDRTTDDEIVLIGSRSGVVVPRNLAKTAARGQEVSLSMNWRGHVGFDGGYTLLDALNRTPGPSRNARVPFQPEHAGDASVWGAADWVRLTYGISANSAFFLDDANAVERPGRIEHDVEVVGQWQSWAMSLAVHNLLDRRTVSVDRFDGGNTISLREPVSDFGGFPLPGRAFYATLSYASH